MANVSSSATDDFIHHDVSSFRTRPLLYYLLNQRPSLEKADKLSFLHVKHLAGNTPIPIEIPDESEPLKQDLVNLIDQGFPEKITSKKKVTIIGAGCSGLCAGYELQKAGFDVQILEASSRVGGRVITFRDPNFAPGLHGEGGAMRIPKNHFLLHEYIRKFGLETTLFDFEMENKFIYLSGLGKTITYKEFDLMLTKQDPALMKLFPNLKTNEKGKTCDTLFEEAIQPVVDDFWKAYHEWIGGPADAAKVDSGEGGTSQKVQAANEDPKKVEGDKIKHAYAEITKKYDKYSLRSYLTEVAGWSQDAINLYDLGNAHVVFENGLIESWKDAFLSSNSSGTKAGMEQLGDGMDQVPRSFIRSKAVDPFSLIDNITFGARVKRIERDDKLGFGQTPIKVIYDDPAGQEVAVTSNYLVLAIPYTSQRSITKSHPFAPKQEMAIRLVRYVEVTKVLLQYRERWWIDVFRNADQGTDGGLVTDLPIRYTMFPKEDVKNPQCAVSNRGVVMAAYTFEQDATILGALMPARRVALAARNLDTIFPQADSLSKLEASASQVFPADELAGGSAFCYFGPMQKTDFLETMIESDWKKQVFFAGEQASYTHGWIQGAFEAGLRCAQQVYAAAKDSVMWAQAAPLHLAFVVGSRRLLAKLHSLRDPDSDHEPPQRIGGFGVFAVDGNCNTIAAPSHQSPSPPHKYSAEEIIESVQRNPTLAVTKSACHLSGMHSVGHYCYFDQVHPGKG